MKEQFSKKAGVAVSLAPKDVAVLAKQGKTTEIYDGHRPGLRLRVTGQDKAYWRWGGAQRKGKRAPTRTIGPAYKKGWLQKQVQTAQEQAWAVADQWREAFLSDGTTPKEIAAEEAKAADLVRQSTVPTLREYIDDVYTDHVQTRNKDADASLARIESCFYGWTVPKRLRGASPLKLRDWPIDEINQAVVDNWVNDGIKKGKANSTLKRDLTALRAALSPRNVPAAGTWLADTPFRITGLKVKQETHRYLKRGSRGEDNEYERFIEAIDAREEKRRVERRRYNEFRAERKYKPYPDFDAVTFTDHAKPMLLTLLYTGMRPGELRALGWGDVDFANKRLTVRAADTKTGTTRTIPMNQIVCDTLRNWRDQTNGIKTVFIKPDGTPIGSMRKVFDGILRAAKIESFRLYDLRHSFASWLVQEGVDLYRIKDLMGHATVTMTERYAHLQPDHGHDAVELLAS